MAKASARELLRRSREQKKQQQQQKGNTGSVEQTGLAEIVKHDLFAKASANGTLSCRLCDTLVKPASAVGWSVHTKSRRHVQHITENSANATQNPTKRSHDEVAIGSDVSDNLAQRLTIDQDTKDASLGLDKDEEDESEAKRRKVGNLVMYGSDKDSEDEKEEQPEDIATDGGLPQGFFDEGVEKSMDEDNVSGKAAESPKLPDGFFDSPKEPTAKSQIPINKMQLTYSLAAFENDIADLAEITEPLDIESKNEPEELVGDLESQASRWANRTRHLAKLHSIIEEGARGMVEDDAESMRDVASDTSSGDEDYAGFTSWRLGQL
ncbi:hypothetical protein GGH96_000912 [Coemansia sp. RSA 1972]|nr:hypothetical protein GGH96_000912 [Coemansia sp. RSA 1972]